MGRTIRPGAKVLVRQARRPRRGEIWAFCKADGTVVVHRYRRRIAGRHCFQGDAVPFADEPVEATCLVGRIVAIDDGGAVRRVGALDALVGRIGMDLGTLRRRLRSVTSPR